MQTTHINCVVPKLVFLINSFCYKCCC